MLKILRSESADDRAAALEVLPWMDVDKVLDDLTSEAGLARRGSKYALAVLITAHGNAILHRVMARVGDRVNAEEMHSLVRLVQFGKALR